MVGTDWKSALAALGGADTAAEPEKKNNVDRKKRVGVVYSTHPSYDYVNDSPDTPTTLPHAQQRLRLQMERAGRSGKTVTLVKGFIGSDDDLTTLCKLLKQRCGLGGSVKDGTIIIQGDHRTRLVEILKREGYTQTK